MSEKMSQERNVKNKTQTVAEMFSVQVTVTVFIIYCPLDIASIYFFISKKKKQQLTSSTCFDSSVVISLTARSIQ